MNWDLKKIYKNESDLKKDLKLVKDNTVSISKYEGKLSDSNTLKEYYMLVEENVQKGLKCYMYAMLNFHLDMKDASRKSLFEEVKIVFTNFNNARTFEKNELLNIGVSIKEIARNDDYLNRYSQELDDLFRSKEHILSPKEEQILSDMNKVFSATRMYDSLAVSDNASEIAVLNDGTNLEVTSNNWKSHIAKLKDPEDRKEVFEACFYQYFEKKNTYASIYNAILQSDVAIAKSRKYNSCLEYYLDKNNIPTSVYTTLCDVTKKNTDALKKYYKLKADYLKIDNFRTYDRAIPLVELEGYEYTYEQAKEWFFESIKGMSKEFQDKQRETLSDGYVDVEECDGKQGGAYSMSVHGIHPYILLNHSNSIDDVFTVAHEAGHSAHSLFSQENQTYNNSSYSIYLAEIASTFNEHLLLDYLMETLTSKDEKVLLLQRAIDDIAGTYFRQTLFADYELQAHNLVENDIPVTYVELSNIMIDLYDKYYGIDIREEEYKEYVWAYIPHFYSSSFYVYQYATAFSASLKIYEDIKSNKPDAEKKYIDMLKGGCSEYPVDLAKKAGADLTSDDCFLAVINRFEDLVNKLEKLLNE